MVDQGNNDIKNPTKEPEKFVSVRPGGPKLDKSTKISGTGDVNPTEEEPDSILLTERPLINNDEQAYSPDLASDSDKIIITTMQTKMVTSNSEQKGTMAEENHIAEENPIIEEENPIIEEEKSNHVRSQSANQ